MSGFSAGRGGRAGRGSGNQPLGRGSSQNIGGGQPRGGSQSIPAGRGNHRGGYLRGSQQHGGQQSGRGGYSTGPQQNAYRTPAATIYLQVGLIVTLNFKD